MNCPHPQNQRFVHIASQVFPDENTVVRDERCLCCDALLSVTYRNGVMVNTAEEHDTPETLAVDAPLPPLQPIPQEDVELPDNSDPVE